MSDTPLSRIDGTTGARRHFRYFDYVMVAFVMILLLSNLIGAAKQAQVTLPVLGTITFGAGVLFFPVSYIIGDVLTEVYGYANARRCIWAGFFALLFMVLMSVVVVNIPASPEWALASATYTIEGKQVTAPNQAAYYAIFGQTPRIVFASLVAFWAGEFVNSFVLARMKVWTEGKHLWTRTIGSTIFGEGVDSALFYPLAFLGVAGFTPQLVVTLAITQWIIKTLWEVVLTPVTYLVVGFLKRREGVDVYDEGIDFSPFAKTGAV
ncbi:queuosine precursor transporter [Novosphingobium album (ex Liu et al. 2023)]|uniref:Probable queuosine precursor transporter n=1 Tax=Novosphingobium album (ex Liu et al. 2023) TaxID=3031130 RepID=A0ABT5WLG8_9SPHN|nr:queuosine precursor transporter [Novosphingobium album (ex Liu et al. 2023)]MDE8650881.1 queuosine precursor transporter [Novosphingobium album (ex Liu et al. 2023)]